MKELSILLLLLVPCFGFSSKLEDIDETKLLNIARSHKGKTLVVFWGVYCPYCKQYLKNINESSSYFSSKDIKVVAISVDYDRQLVKNYALQTNYFFPLYYDAGRLKKKYNAYYIPLTVILDSKGEIEDTFPGNKTMDKLKELLEE
ncbi:MAG: TlpA family protein disulfide reductase [Deferribacterales bacterium]